MGVGHRELSGGRTGAEGGAQEAENVQVGGRHDEACCGGGEKDRERTRDEGHELLHAVPRRSWIGVNEEEDDEGEEGCHGHERRGWLGVDVGRRNQVRDYDHEVDAHGQDLQVAP